MLDRIELKAGDTVQVLTRGAKLEGKVIRAFNYGTKEKPNWYIEFNDDRHGYIYFKQEIDRGAVTKC